MVNVFDFTGTYTLDNLRPYTVYDVYITATRMIGDTGRLLEGMKSRTINQRTLTGSMLLHLVVLIAMQLNFVLMQYSRTSNKGT